MSVKRMRPGKMQDTAKAGATMPAQVAPKLTKDQKYFAPLGRHSQQSHRLAIERATTQGHASEKEQHAYDRGIVKAEWVQRAATVVAEKQTKQNARGKTATSTASESQTENKPE